MKNKIFLSIYYLEFEPMNTKEYVKWIHLPGGGAAVSPGPGVCPGNSVCIGPCVAKQEKYFIMIKI